MRNYHSLCRQPRNSNAHNDLDSSRHDPKHHVTPLSRDYTKDYTEIGNIQIKGIAKQKEVLNAWASVTIGRLTSTSIMSASTHCQRLLMIIITLTKAVDRTGCEGVPENLNCDRPGWMFLWKWTQLRRLYEPCKNEMPRFACLLHTSSTPSLHTPSHCRQTALAHKCRPHIWYW